MLFRLSCSAAPLSCSAAQVLNCRCCFLRAHSPGTPRAGTRPLIPLIVRIISRGQEHTFGLHHSTTFEKSSPYLHQGTFSTHMVPDLARWPNSVRGKLLFGASERLLNHPGADLDHPIVPELEDGEFWDGQNPSFYVKWQNLTVPMCSILEFWHYRIVQFGPRVVQEPFRGSKKQFAS